MYIGEGPWPPRVREGLRTTLEWFAADPEASRFLLVETSTVGPTFRSIFKHEYARFTGMLDEGFDDSAPRPELTEATSLGVGALLAKIYEEILLDRVAELPRLLPDLTYDFLVPFVGEDVGAGAAARRSSPNGLPDPPPAAAPGAAGCARCSNSSIPEGSLTVVSVASPSIKGRATPASTGVTSPIQSEESHGVSSGTVIRRGGWRPEGAGELVDHAAVGGHVGAADFDLAIDREAESRGGGEVGDGVRDGDRLGPGDDPAGGDHQRQAADQVEGGAEGLAAGADHRGGAEVGDGHLALAQGFRRRVAAVEVLRPLPQPAEVDDPLDPGRGGGRGRSSPPLRGRARRSRRRTRGPSSGRGSRRRRRPPAPGRASRAPARRRGRPRSRPASARRPARDGAPAPAPRGLPSRSRLQSRPPM